MLGYTLTPEDPEVEKILQKKMMELTAKEKEVSYAPLNLSDQNFSNIVKSKPLAIVDFWAEWCGPCRVMLPIFERLAKRYGDRVVFGRLNADEYGELASKFSVYSIPTFIVFQNGVPADRVVGAVGEQGLEELLLKHLAGR